MQTSPFTQIREGQEIAVECPHCHMRMRVPFRSAGVRATCSFCHGVTSFRFSLPGSAPATGTRGNTLANGAASLLGLVLIVGGMVLVIGNLSGAFPTFPFAGFLVSGLGSLILSAAQDGGD